MGSVIEGNCVAARRGGEQPEVNRRSVEPAPAQAGDDEPDSAQVCGEPAHTWRSLEATAGAEATDKATGGQHAWLRAECRDGKAEEAERPAGLGEVGRSQSLHITAMRRWPWRGAGCKTAPREGRQEVGGARSGMRQQAASECTAVSGGRPKHRSGRSAWCRRWATASKEASGTV